MYIGIIGSAGRQGLRFLKLCLDYDVNFVLYDHHGETKKMVNKGFRVTTHLEDLLICKGVIIASSNESHMQYIRYFISKDYEGYIYCEKPPVNNAVDLKQLEQLENSIKRKILFGFDLERSLYKKIIDGEYNLGRLMYCSIISGHGLGYKPFYKESWRNDTCKCKKGIFEMVSIHYLEMFIAKYGFPLKENSFECVKAPEGINIDNNLYSAVWGNEEVLLNIFVSYTTPFIDKSEFVFDNGYISITEDETIVYAPRDCFDSEGMFRTPDVIQKISTGTRQIWDNALRENVNYFLEKVANKKDIPIVEFENALNVNKYILGID